jgi:hypothetical protein
VTANEYIQSGAIEACIAGLGTAEDWRELEYMCAQHPAVAQAKFEMEQAQENAHVALANAQPPDWLKSQVFNQLALNAPDGEAAKQASIVALPASATAPAAVPVVPITQAPKSVIWLRGAIAASIILLMGSVALNFYFYSQSAQNLASYKALVAQQASLLANNQALQTSFDMMRSPEMKVVPMRPPNANPTAAMATVYWHGPTKDVYVLLNRLPNAPPEQQYQLWAMVDGKPVDVGMLPVNDKGTALLRMKNIPKASAFGITLEKKGGSATPSLNAMMVFGEV